MNRTYATGDAMNNRNTRTNYNLYNHITIHAPSLSLSLSISASVSHSSTIYSSGFQYTSLHAMRSMTTNEMHRIARIQHSELASSIKQTQAEKRREERFLRVLRCEHVRCQRWWQTDSSRTQKTMTSPSSP